MKSEKREAFIRGLEELYGEYQYESALFGTYNYSSVSSNLCYSKSHFTKLISGGASEAMYDRAIQNINKLKKLDSLEKKALEIKPEVLDKSQAIWKVLSITLLCFSTFLTYHYFSASTTDSSTTSNAIDNTSHPLEMYFDFNDAHYYKSPYLTEDQVHEYCPCSGYEGRWQLSEEYIIPIPYKIPGLYYLGKKADIRLKCRKSNESNKGQELIGFENIENEIWFDRSMKPIEMAQSGEGDYNSKEIMKKIAEKEDFIKIANVYSCFYDEITIKPDSIYRLGEPCGRYANGIDENILQEYNLDLNHIIEYIIGSMTFAQCSAIANEFSNPNDLENGQSVISFPCKCYSKRENLGLGGAYSYNKSIQLVEQNYQSNLYCKD